jgi:protein O-mannosyl-transferase
MKNKGDMNYTENMENPAAGRALKSWKNIFIILASTALAYLNTLNNGFVWDDKLLLVPNEAYQKPDLIKIFTTRVNSIEYLPFRDLSYVLDFSIWGLNPFGFHLTNLVLYLISLVVLYSTVRSIAAAAGEAKHETIAFLTTLIFALHPLHAEVVNFIHGRNTLLAGLFLFLSFNLYLKGVNDRKNLMLFLSAASFIVAVFSKAIVIFYPVFLAVLLFLSPESIISKRRKLLVLAAFTAIDVFAGWIHFISAGEADVMDINFIMYGNDDWGVKFAKALQIPFFYLKMFALPYPLSVAYMVPFLSEGLILRLILSGATIAAALVVVFQKRKIQPLLYIGTAWFVLSLGPVLNIFPTSPVVADRYAYLPVLGLSILSGVLISRLIAVKRLFLYAAVIMLILWAGIDFKRNLDWRSDITLWKSETAINPLMDKTNLAVAFWEAGQYEKALSSLEEEKAKAGSFRYEQYKGKYFFMMGDHKSAISYYQEAINRGGDAQKEIHVELGTVYENSGLYREALEEYLKVMDMGGIDPLKKYEKKAAAGIERIRAKLIPEVEQVRRLALQEPMDFKAQAVYALSLHRLGLYEEAEEFYKRALKINPSSWEAWYNLAITFMKRHRYKEAVMSFEKSVLLNQTNKDAFNNLGICYMSMRNYSQAIKYYEKALLADPDFYYPAFNLGRIYFIRGDRDMSVKYFSLAKELSAGNPGIDTKIDSYLSQLK